jgi:arginase family enzyme|tara:strand:- start:24 stop:263 length:240 start_codon:yes stop_codon:yes gene_type:complete
MNRYFRKENETESSKYWISFDASSLSSQDFKSALMNDENGLSLDFVMRLYEQIIPKSIGMDLTEVNFEMTSGMARHNDQ